MDEKLKIFGIIVVVGVIIWVVSQITKLLDALVPLVIILGAALIFLIVLTKKEVIKTPKILEGLLKKK
ncbi:MAG: hypothetical protein HQ543_08145 [Bacteroidetes bacterium]|nr:hypothetical protein [Bacteroidota bacterium]